MADAPERAPKRAYGFWICLALVIGNMVGSGFFLMPATLAPFGWNGVAGWVVTTAGALCLAVVFGSLARAMPRAGGPYAYSRAAFGPFAAFLVAWAYWVSMWIGNVAIATGVLAPLSTIFPGIADHSVLITLALVWSLTAINCFGAKAVGRIQLVTTILKFLPLIAVVVLASLVLGGGEAQVPPLRSEALSLSGPTGIAAAVTLTLWAFLGLESATVPAERVEAPERNIPRATLIGVAVTGAVLPSPVRRWRCSCRRAAAQSAAPMATSSPALGGEAATLMRCLRRWPPSHAQWLDPDAGRIALGDGEGRRFPSGLPSSPASEPRRAPHRRQHPAHHRAAAQFGSLDDRPVRLPHPSRHLGVADRLSGLFAGRDPARVNKSRNLIFALGALFSIWAIWGAGTEALKWGLVLLLSGVPLYLLMRRTGHSSPAAAADPAVPPGSAA